MSNGSTQAPPSKAAAKRAAHVTADNRHLRRITERTREAPNRDVSAGCKPYEPDQRARVPGIHSSLAHVGWFAQQRRYR